MKHGLSSEIVRQLKSVFALEMKPEIFTQLWNEGEVFYQASSAGRST